MSCLVLQHSWTLDCFLWTASSFVVQIDDEKPNCYCFCSHQIKAALLSCWERWFVFWHATRLIGGHYCAAYGRISQNLSQDQLTLVVKWVTTSMDLVECTNSQVRTLFALSIDNYWVEMRFLNHGWTWINIDTVNIMTLFKRLSTNKKFNFFFIN